MKLKYYSLREISKILGVPSQTLRNWDRSRKLKPHHTTSNGYHYDFDKQLSSMFHKLPRTEKTTWRGFDLNWWISVSVKYEESADISISEGIRIDIGKDLAICSGKKHTEISIK